MEEGEVYAIETFASTGQGMVMENGEGSHYALVPDMYADLRMQSARKLLSHIKKTFGTLPFCPRWLVREDGGSFAVNGNQGQQKMYHAGLRSLVDQGVVREYLLQGLLRVPVGAHADAEVGLEGSVLVGNGLLNARAFATNRF